MYQSTGIWGSSHTGVGTWLFPAIPARWLLEITSPFFPQTGRRDYFYTAADHLDKNKWKDNLRPVIFLILLSPRDLRNIRDRGDQGRRADPKNLKK